MELLTPVLEFKIDTNFRVDRFRPVLCLEFMYLRVITGSEDGRIRIWNAITGQCCRIMRGNSRSDPVLALIAIDNQ